MTPAPSPVKASLDQHERVRTRSKLVFGNRDRLEVMAAIARSADGMVNATDLGAEIGMVQSRVRNQLVALAEAGMLTAYPRSPDVKRWYQRNECPLWAAGLAVYEDWKT